MKTAADHNPLKTVLLISSGWLHPSWLARLYLAWGLSGLPGYRFHRTDTLENLPDNPGEHYAGLVLYFHQKSISPTALQRLESYIQQGGGLLAVHSAAASFKEEAGYTRLLGGKFIRHGPVTEFIARPCSDDRIFAGLQAFQVRDELYRHTWDPSVQVHFSVSVPGEEQAEPLVWTRQHGAGRVCYCALGHRAAVFLQPPVMRLLHSGLAWVCSGGTGNRAAA